MTDLVSDGLGSAFGGAVGGDLRPTASYTLRVNGFERPVSDAWIGESLLYVLRERLGLAGAKDGCEQGECGACSVQVDGQLVAGCLVPAALASESEIATVEGLSADGSASDVQQALADSGAVQCGYCTPGMAMAVHDLLQRNHRPSEVEARQALCGNLCRCTGYQGVLAAVQTVAEARGLAEEEALAAAEAAAAGEQPAAASGSAAGAEAEAAEVAAAVADLPTAGELPLYADSEVWVEAEPALPEYGLTTHQTGVYEPGFPAGAPYGPGFDPAPYDPGHDAVYEPVQGEATPAHGTAYDGPAATGTPAHGTPYVPTPAHGTAYDPGYEQGPGQGFDHGLDQGLGQGLGQGLDQGTVYEGGFEQTYQAFDGGYRPGYDPASAQAHDGTTPPHGIRHPEDDRA
ncbi:(2Fe-2S)-binding protein [Kitasatospora sp. NPDC051853]|uniref:(2Fe-2S)-binding protein n=1 Tax=Kitasatospora sp. NPDC051853 TaxID=3364058 RepID=UPI00378B2240